MKWIALILAGTLGLSAGIATQAIAAEPFPTRPVTLIIPFPPGGGTDILARPLAEALAKRWGQPVIVENKAGAGGGIGTALAARAAPDGHTLVLGTVGTHAINQSLFSRLPYDGVRDFDAVTLVANTPNILVVHPDVPADSVQALIEYARQHPDRLNYASPGNGTPPHLAAEMFKHMAGVSITHVPYKGTGPALTDLLGGTVQMMIANAPAVLPHIASGKLRALASTSERRSDILPNLATLDESGLPGYEADTWYGLFTAKGVPPDVLTQLNADVVDILRAPALQTAYAQQGAQVMALPSVEAARKVATDAQKWGSVVSSLGLRLD